MPDNIGTNYRHKPRIALHTKIYILLPLTLVNVP